MVCRSRLVIFSSRKSSVFWHPSASRLGSIQPFWRSSLKKWYLRFYLTQIVDSNGKMLFPWRKKLFIKVSMARRSRLVIFSSRKSSVFRHASASRLGSVYCLNRSEDLRWKNDISGFIWHKPFIQTVKCSFFSQIIVYQSFYGALLTFNYFFLQGKVRV